MKYSIINLLISLGIIFCTSGYLYNQLDINKGEYKPISNPISEQVDNSIKVENVDVEKENKIDDWRIRLVNIDNSLPEDFQIELANIDYTRKFDKRAIDELLTMMKDAKAQGINDMWVQSSYRSVERQKELFEKKVNEYLAQGKTKDEAESLTLKKINKPGTSEHNLGLAVDFNHVTYDFEKTKAYNWLQKNAEKYGFILRYRKDKKEITKVDYEPWHWRYVGVEHAKKINELGMCLEEYVEYLKNN